ncbi:MAG: ABC-F family ATP-binding cassette domain-containing protein [Ignavibacteriaceae bacterium]
MIDFIDVSLQFGGRYLFKEINYKINAGDRIALVGANGAGKTSLLRLISGEQQPESGNLYKQKRINIGYLPQEHIIHQGNTILKEAESALTSIVELQGKEKELTDLLYLCKADAERDDLVNQLGEVHHRLEDLGSFSALSEVERILAGLGFTEPDFTRMTDEFSGGWQMRIALAKILISQNDLLLLDEPTNHLDLDSLEWLISFLNQYKGALLIVSHDKHFVNSVTNKTLEISAGKFYSYKGKYEEYIKSKEAREELAEKHYTQQQKKIKDTEKFIERFRYKATKAKQVQSRIKQLEKLELVELPESIGGINIRFPEPPLSGVINIELESIRKSYGSNLIFENLSFNVERGDKIAFVGPNGAGKTTLAKIIAGEIDFDSGTKKLGYNTAIAYYAQDVADNLNTEMDILETVESIAENQSLGQLRAILGCFLFSGDDVFKKVKILSGGEKSRVALSKILLTKANLIILDEPTNHLDYNSKLVLQNALVNFSGSLILVSHDIDFLNPIVNKVVEIRKGSIKTFLGGIEDYLYKKQEDAKSDATNRKEKNQESLQSSNRKEQKRLEAELRQKRYELTKDLKKEVTTAEARIARLETKLKNLELELTQEEIYRNPQAARDKNNEYSRIKQEIKDAYAKWEALAFRLEKIEKELTL